MLGVWLSPLPSGSRRLLPTPTRRCYLLFLFCHPRSRENMPPAITAQDSLPSNFLTGAAVTLPSTHAARGLLIGCRAQYWQVRWGCSQTGKAESHPPPPLPPFRTHFQPSVIIFEFLQHKMWGPFLLHFCFPGFLISCLSYTFCLQPTSTTSLCLSSLLLSCPLCLPLHLLPLPLWASPHGDQPGKQLNSSSADSLLSPPSLSPPSGWKGLPGKGPPLAPAALWSACSLENLLDLLHNLVSPPILTLTPRAQVLILESALPYLKAGLLNETGSL